jgi:UDP-GlcNAc:undecaprenyl-phosphate GlcNAc-1-phosphate transferase
VLLYGAGDAGVLTLRELRRNPELGRRPIGFVDDDPLKQGQTIQGLKVEGTGEDIVRVCRQKEVDEVIVTTTTMPETRQRAIYRKCREADIPCTEFGVTVEPLQPEPSVMVGENAELVAQ